MKAFFATIAALSLTGCALFSGSPQGQWDRQTLVYTNLAERVVELREPCVTQGPTHPDCVLDDSKYAKVRIIQTTADGYLKAAELQIAAGEEGKAKFYLSSAAGALLALADQLGVPSPKIEE